MESKYSRHQFYPGLLVCCLLLTFSLFPVDRQPATAISISDYFTLSYRVTLSIAEVQQGEEFTATASGSAVCKAELPVTVSSAFVTSRVVAVHQITGTKVTLNPGFTVTIDPFPGTVGDSIDISREISLTFPRDSPAGTYTVTGELIEARVQAVIPIDVTDYLPATQSIGTVEYLTSDSGDDLSGSSGVSITDKMAVTTATTTTSISTDTTTAELVSGGTGYADPSTTSSGISAAVTSEIKPADERLSPSSSFATSPSASAFTDVSIIEMSEPANPADLREKESLAWLLWSSLAVLLIIGTIVILIIVGRKKM